MFSIPIWRKLFTGKYLFVYLSVIKQLVSLTKETYRSQLLTINTSSHLSRLIKTWMTLNKQLILTLLAMLYLYVVSCLFALSLTREINLDLYD